MTSILCYLLKCQGIEIDLQDNQKRTPLHHAIMRGCIKNAEALMNKNANLNVSDGAIF